MSLRKFEVRQANDILETLVAHATDGVVEAYVADLAETAGLSRVQAQVGLRILVQRGRVVVERKGRRASPGRLRIVSDAPIRWSEESDELVGTIIDRAAPEQGPMLTFLQLENNALRLENRALRDRVAALEARIDLLTGDSPPLRAQSG